MAIQIIDGFQVNTALPIDNRIVASGSAARNAIPYKYHGLRVFDISNNIPYVWNGSSWISENASGVVGSGTAEYIPLYTSSNVISNSLLYQYNGIIKTADNGNGADLAQIDPEYGTVYAQGGFYGPGTSITNIDGSNIIDGSIPVDGGSGLGISKLVNGSTGQVLISGVSKTQWSNQSLLSVGTASGSRFSLITNTSATNGTHYLAFVSSGAWTSTTAATSSIRASSADLSYNPSTKTLNATRIDQNGGALLGTAGSKLTFANLTSTTSTNTSNLEFNNVRNSAGTDWLTSAYRIQSKVDVEYLAYIQFNGTNNDAGISFGTGYQSTNSTSNSNERVRISSAGLLTVNGTMKHVSPTFSTTSISPTSFVVGTGNLTRATQITISSVTYDRVIYVYSSSNENNYYSTSGFFEIEIYIINGSVNQQIYTIFHGNDSDIRPTGIGYNYILPAGSSSTISLYKGNSLAWNAGSGPTIYAKSLKFGL